MNAWDRARYSHVVRFSGVRVSVSKIDPVIYFFETVQETSPMIKLDEVPKLIRLLSRFLPDPIERTLIQEALK